MTSEIRANTLKNRVGLGTVSFTNTGPVVSGIVTANTFRLPDATSGSLGRLQIGNGLDLSLFHNGIHSYLQNSTGSLFVLGDALKLRDANGVDAYIECFKDGAVNISYNDSIKIQTTNTGAVVTGILTATTFVGNGDFVELDVDGHTNLDNVSIAGVTTFSEDTKFIGATSGRDLQWDKSDNTLEFLDYTAAKFGTDNNLTIYHNSGNNNSYISENGVGSLLIQATDLYLTNTAGQNHVICATGGRVQLNFNGNDKLQTTNTGIKLTSGVASGGGISNMLQLDNTGNNNGDGGKITFSRAGTIRTEIEALKNETANNETDIVFRTTNAGSLGEKVRIESGGGLKFTGQGTSIPVGGILHHTNNNLYVRGGTNGLILGNDNNYTTIQIYDTYMKFETNDGTEKLRIDSNGYLSFAGDTDTYIWHPSANQLAITRAGGSAPLMRWGTGGNGVTVGINTDGNLVTNSEILSVRGYSSFKSLNDGYAAIYTHNEEQGNSTIASHILFNVGGANRGGFGYDTDNSTLIMGNQNSISFKTGATQLGGTERLRISSDGRIGMSQNSPDAATLHIGNSVASTGSNVALQVGTITGQNRYLAINHFGNQQNFSSLKMRVNDNALVPMLDMGNPYGSDTHGTKIKFSGYQDSEVGAIESVNTAANSSSSVDMVLRTGAGPKEVLRLQSNGDARFYNGLSIAKVDNDNSNFTRSGFVLSTPAYTEYQYTWSGQSSYTIDLTCGSYFHSEFIYVQHQTNGGHHMHHYVRGKWANNHYTHTGFIYEHSGNGGALGVTFTASDQSGGGAVDMKGGLTEAGTAGASYRARYGGGHEGSSSTANGRFRISETMATGSVGGRGLIIKVYYGSFSISKS